jgi:hypothetical protein
MPINTLEREAFFPSPGTVKNSGYNSEITAAE